MTTKLLQVEQRFVKAVPRGCPLLFRGLERLRRGLYVNRHRPLKKGLSVSRVLTIFHEFPSVDVCTAERADRKRMFQLRGKASLLYFSLTAPSSGSAVPNQESWKSGELITLSPEVAASSSSMVKSQYGRVSLGLTRCSIDERVKSKVCVVGTNGQSDRLP